MKARRANEVMKFEDIPNIGPAMVRDFKRLGLKSPSDLKKAKPFALYKKMSLLAGRQDPCVLDTYIAAVDFMNGAPARPWYYYTVGRKKDFPTI